MMQTMRKSEKYFWGVVAISGLYLFATFSFDLGTRVNAQQSAPSQQVAAVQAPAKGMSCGAAGGGCGCGAMMKKAQ
jgi:hypothetical protein